MVYMYLPGSIEGTYVIRPSYHFSRGCSEARHSSLCYDAMQYLRSDNHVQIVGGSACLWSSWRQCCDVRPYGLNWPYGYRPINMELEKSDMDMDMEYGLMLSRT